MNYFFQQIPLESQEVHEKRFNITDDEEMQIKITMKCHFIPKTKGYLKKQKWNSEF